MGSLGEPSLVPLPPPGSVPRHQSTPRPKCAPSSALGLDTRRACGIGWGAASEPRRFAGLRTLRASRIPPVCFSVKFPLFPTAPGKPVTALSPASHPHPQCAGNSNTETEGREPGAGGVASAHLHIICQRCPRNGLRLPQPAPARPVVSTSSHPMGDKGCRQAGAPESSEGTDWPSWGMAIPFWVWGRHSKMTGAPGYPHPGAHHGPPGPHTTPSKLTGHSVCRASPPPTSLAAPGGSYHT